MTQQQAWLRLVLGFLQMTGATAALLLLFKNGPTPAALVATAGTCSLTVLSMFLFRRRGLDGRR